MRQPHPRDHDQQRRRSNRHARSYDALGRDAGFALDGGYAVSYAYDMFGRFHSVSASVASACTYGYLDGSDLVSANAVVLSTRSILWDNYNIIAETIHSSIPSIQSSTNLYVRGLDLSGSLQGAGGVGGLLAVSCVSSNTSYLSPLTYYPLYDANGNVTEYVDDSGTIAAHYEYSPFGETVVQSGSMADTFTHRFSTKPWCPVTGLSEYELRMYSPGMGRWLSRDPINERGGINLFCMTLNKPVNAFDINGHELGQWTKFFIAASSQIIAWLGGGSILNPGNTFPGPGVELPPKEDHGPNFPPGTNYAERKGLMYNVQI